ncbi:MAG: OmpA family protein [Moraxellaceae bacterium]|nr:OmpA family protein [Moraxellaceae bacterium]
MMNRVTRLLLATALPASLLLATACTPVGSRVPGYLTTPKGKLLQNSVGQCWRTVEWRPSLAIPECDPEIVKEQQALAQAEEKAEEDKAEEEKKEDEVVRPRGRRYAGTQAFGFVPNAMEEDALVEAGTREVTGADGTVRTEIVYAPLTLSNDTSFRFGDDQLTPEGRDNIIELAGTLKRRRAQNISIDVTGHTDRIGTASANLALSRRRAEAVKAMLVKEGIPASGIRTAGMGASKPVTDAGDCPDRLVKCELIECLRPDRRVDIKVKAEVDSGKRAPVAPKAAPAAAAAPAPVPAPAPATATPAAQATGSSSATSSGAAAATPAISPASVPAAPEAPDSSGLGTPSSPASVPATVIDSKPAAPVAPVVTPDDQSSTAQDDNGVRTARHPARHEGVCRA